MEPSDVVAVVSVCMSGAVALFSGLVALFSGVLPSILNRRKEKAARRSFEATRIEERTTALLDYLSYRFYLDADQIELAADVPPERVYSRLWARLLAWEFIVRPRLKAPELKRVREIKAQIMGSWTVIIPTPEARQSRVDVVKELSNEILDLAHIAVTRLS